MEMVGYFFKLLLYSRHRVIFNLSDMFLCDYRMTKRKNSNLQPVVIMNLKDSLEIYTIMPKNRTCANK